MPKRVILPAHPLINKEIEEKISKVEVIYIARVAIFSEDRHICARNKGGREATNLEVFS